MHEQGEVIQKPFAFTSPVAKKPYIKLGGSNRPIESDVSI